MHKFYSLLLVLTILAAGNLYAGPGHHHKGHKAIPFTISALSNELSLRVNKYIGETEKNLSYFKKRMKKGQAFKATVLQPKKLAKLGLKGMRKGDRVKVVALTKGRLGLVPLRPKMKPVILKKKDGVMTSCGCFEHAKDLQILQRHRMPKKKVHLHKHK